MTRLRPADKRPSPTSIQVRSSANHSLAITSRSALALGQDSTSATHLSRAIIFPIRKDDEDTLQVSWAGPDARGSAGSKRGGVPVNERALALVTRLVRYPAFLLAYGRLCRLRSRPARTPNLRESMGRQTASADDSTAASSSFLQVEDWRRLRNRRAVVPRLRGAEVDATRPEHHRLTVADVPVRGPTTRRSWPRD